MLLGLFFVSVGTELDLSRLFREPLVVVGIALGLIAIKTVVLFLTARVLRMPRRIAGEVSLLLGAGRRVRLRDDQSGDGRRPVPEAIAGSLLVAVTLTMAATPLIARVAERLARRLPQSRETVPFQAPPPDDGEARVLIVGYGRVGRLVSEMVAVHDLPFLAIDDDAALVGRDTRSRHADHLRRRDPPRVPASLRPRGSARPCRDRQHPADCRRGGRVARAERADLTIVARARDAAHASKLYEAGVTDAVPETIEASLQLSEAVLVDIGVPMGYVIASIHEKRDEFRRFLNEAQPATAARPERRAIRRPRRT